MDANQVIDVDNKVPMILKGYDNRSVLYDTGSFMTRKITSGYFDVIEDLYGLYRINNLESIGIVATELDRNASTLRHEKHIISYPYEWTANMFKDAVLFHVKLFLQLDAVGLTLKDALPNNILFSGTNPVFVDFPSLVRTKNLQDEAWLVEDTSHIDFRIAVVEKMLIPYMLIPLMTMSVKKHSLARRMLSDKACNCGGGIPRWRDMGVTALPLVIYTGWMSPLAPLLTSALADSSKYKHMMKLYGIAEKRCSLEFIEFMRQMADCIESTNVTPTDSPYLSYYENKKGNFAFDNQEAWNSKQKNVSLLLNSVKPTIVLDLGANTGWFSILSARSGASVVATDVDESSIDSLYTFAKSKRLNIVPLLISFDDLSREISGEVSAEVMSGDRDCSPAPLFLPATRRLQADMVLCLGLFHHLILGMDKKISKVMTILSDLTTQCLVLEFVSIDDKLIQDDPPFFKNLNNYSSDNYNIDVVVAEGMKYFNRHQIMDSDSITRKLIVFHKVS